MRHFYRELLLLFLVVISVQIFSQETRKVVAVVDTGLPYNRAILPYLCKGLQYDVTEHGIQDYNGHGTNVLGLVAKGINPKTHCLSMIKWWHTAEETNLNKHLVDSRIKSYMNILSKIQPVLINMSLSGSGYSVPEYEGLKSLLSKGIKAVVAAGNTGSYLTTSCTSYPACYAFKDKNFYVVGTSDSFSNFGGPVTDILPGSDQCGIFGLCMSGTSQATGNKSAELLKEMN